MAKDELDVAELLDELGGLLGVMTSIEVKYPVPPKGNGGWERSFSFERDSKDEWI